MNETLELRSFEQWCRLAEFLDWSWSAMLKVIEDCERA